MNNVSEANFLLIDGVLRDNALASLYQRGELLEIEPLYITTRYQGLQSLGPILVAVRGCSTLIDETYRTAVGQTDASLLYSREPISVVANHLRRFIAPMDVQGGNGLLRFADPLVARFWLRSYQDAHLAAVLGPIGAWHIYERPHAWMQGKVGGWRSFCPAAPTSKWTDAHALLGYPQLGALEQAGRWRLMERLYGSLYQNAPEQLAAIDKGELSEWFDGRLDSAQAFGLTSERSLAIWSEYSLRFGNDFALRADGPYQRWLACSPHALSLAADLRLERMDHEAVT